MTTIINTPTTEDTTPISNRSIPDNGDRSVTDIQNIGDDIGPLGCALRMHIQEYYGAGV